MKKLNPPIIGLSMTLLLLGACGGGDGSGPANLISDEDLNAARSSSSSASSSSDADSDTNRDVRSENWSLVWEDNFDGDEIDSSKWSHEVNCAGGGNNERQCYTAREENSYVEDGHLHIVALEETFNGPAVFDDDPAYNPDDTSGEGDYTSARLRTKNKGDWRYGRIEVNAKMPEGQGLWPAIWMLPTENVYGGWPLSGEIDIFEAVNTNAAGENNVHATLHYGRPWPGNVHSGTSYTPEEPIWENFHTYAIEWEEGEIRWYVDDTHYATQTADGWFTMAWQGQDEGFQVGEGAAPFNENFHLLLNVAVGGDWPGAPDETTTFPQEMVVDSVRVYECDIDPDTGKGCAWVSESAEPVEGAGGELVETALYQDGPATLEFDVFDTQVSNTLVPGQWADDGVTTVVDSGLQVDDQTVWDVQFNGLSNVFLNSGDMSEVEYVDDGLAFSVDPEQAALTFDLKVIDASDNASLSVKLDSGWPNVSAREITLPDHNDWQSVSVRFSDFVGTTGDQPGEVNYSNIVAPFVLELTEGSAHVQVNNVEFKCVGSSCGIRPQLDGTAPEGTDAVDVFVDGELGTAWTNLGIDVYIQEDSGKSIVIDRVDDEARETEVIQVRYNDVGYGTMYIQSPETLDLSAYAGGNLVFDLKVMQAGNNVDGFLVKADCGYPCSSKEIPVPLPTVGEWSTITVPVSDLMEKPDFEVDSVDTPISIWPVIEQQSNVIFRLDNIRWEVGE